MWTCLTKICRIVEFGAMYHPGTHLASQAISSESAQSLLALLEQCARVHLLFSTSPGLAALLRSDGFFSGAVCLPEALFMVFLLDSKDFLLVYIFIISFSTSVLFSKRRISVNLVDLVKSFQTSVQIFIFQSLSMSLFSIFFSNEIAIQTSIYYLDLFSSSIY